MKLDELKVAGEYRFKGQKCTLLGEGSPRGMAGSIELLSGNVFKLTVVGRVYNFRLESDDMPLIADLLNRGFKNICNVLNYHDKDHSEVFVIDIVFFSGSSRMGDLNIYISDKVKEMLVRKRLVDAKNADKPEAYSVFAESFMFRDGSIPCFAYTDGNYYLPETPARDGDRFSQAPDQDDEQAATDNADEQAPAENEQENAPADDAAEQVNSGQESTETAAQQSADESADNAGDKDAAQYKKDSEKKHRALKIYGKDCTLFVRAEGTGDQVRLIAEKVTFSEKNIPCMRLGYGQIKFNTESTFIAGEVKRLLQESPGYIELWNTYANLEGEFLLRRARAIDTMSFKDPVPGKEGTVTLFFGSNNEDDAAVIESKLKRFKAGDQVNLGWVPVYLQDPEMSWEDYKQLPPIVRSGGVSLSEYYAADKFTRFNPVKRESAVVKKITDNSITLDWQNSSHLPQSPMSLSIRGYEKQILRREDARALIENGESANPQLGLIIDGNSLSSPHKGSNIRPLSEYVRSKIFPKHPPTDNQIRAIDIALNTPDIAVIQGPPGTGKTTVIKAIIERLNETGRKKDYEAGSVLVTSLQHDAVYNVSKALDINGLPTIKFGTRKNDDATEELDWDKWCSNVVDGMMKKYPQLQQSMQQSELRRQLQMYLSSPDDDKAKALLEQFRMLPISNELVKRAGEMLLELSSGGTEDTDELLAAIRRLRTTKRGFLDDGQANAMSLYRKLSGLGFAESGDEANKDILTVLRNAAVTSAPEKELLMDIKRIRDMLLERCLPPPYYSTPSINEGFVELADEVISSLDRGEDQMDRILREYVNELKRNPEAIKSTVQSYNFVFAATAQQSMGNDVLMAKHISPKDVKENNAFPKYDTVIVDEAARVTPADLMIPMSQAKRRIIFVGDHRQLPHIYDEEIFEEMQNSGEVEHEENIKISMFRHLLKSAKQLEKSDGIIRTVVLNNQYRTHPLLGNFVNECFYKPHDGESFNSPLKADLFAQPICKAPLRWVDIPVSMDKQPVEEKLNTSRFRTAEVEYIAAQLEQYLAREDCRDLTFGVITFYSAQVNMLRKRLGRLAEDPRVRIGSVDSFQGMEFDVVFLSVVRTSHKRITAEDAELVRRLRSEQAATGTLSEKSKIDRDNLGMRYYGFLTSKNRLCVALSRQKRLLIVVGDKDVFTRNNHAELAELCVPAMQNLYELASREGEIINGKC